MLCLEIIFGFFHSEYNGFGLVKDKKKVGGGNGMHPSFRQMKGITYNFGCEMKR